MVKAFSAYSNTQPVTIYGCRDLCLADSACEAWTYHLRYRR